MSLLECLDVGDIDKCIPLDVRRFGLSFYLFMSLVEEIIAEWGAMLRGKYV